MSLHETIAVEMQRFTDEHADCAILSPAALAAAVYAQFSDGTEEPHVAYGCLEHFKGMARKTLAGRFGDEGEKNAAYANQGELFSGHLQERYPLPRKAGNDPVYKLRHLLSSEERAWNISLLRKSGSARLAHADALEAEELSTDPEA